MAWVCICGQRNVLSGLPCLACDAAAPVEESAASIRPRRAGGSRFVDDPVEPSPAPEAQEPPARKGGRRFLPGTEPEEETEPIAASPEPDVAPFDIETHADIEPLEQPPRRSFDAADFETAEATTDDTAADEPDADEPDADEPDPASEDQDPFAALRAQFTDGPADPRPAAVESPAEDAEVQAPQVAAVAPEEVSASTEATDAERRNADRRQTDRRAESSWPESEDVPTHDQAAELSQGLDQAASIDEMKFDSISEIFGFPASQPVTPAQQSVPEVDESALVADLTERDPDATTQQPVYQPNTEFSDDAPWADESSFAAFDDQDDPWSAVSDDLLAPETDDEGPKAPKGEGIDPEITERLRAAAGTGDLTNAWWTQGNDLADHGFAEPQASNENFASPYASDDDDTEGVYDDEYDDDPYAPGPPRSDSRREMFVDDVDLDEPDEFESRSSWQFEDDEEDDPRTARRPGPPPRNRKKVSSGAGGQINKADVMGTLQQRSKLLLVAGGLVLVVLLSTLGSDVFDRIGGASTATGDGAEVACQSADAPTDFDPVSLGETLAFPLEWSAEPDYVAGTGVVDFARALGSEPDTGAALATLDKVRFMGGFDRAFTNEAGDEATITVYAHAGESCASDYVQERTSTVPDSAVALDSDLDKAAGFVDADLSFLIAAVGNRTVAVEVSNDSDGSVAAELLSTQLGLL